MVTRFMYSFANISIEYCFLKFVYIVTCSSNFFYRVHKPPLIHSLLIDSELIFSFSLLQIVLQ